MYFPRVWEEGAFLQTLPSLSWVLPGCAGACPVQSLSWVSRAPAFPLQSLPTSPGWTPPSWSLLGLQLLCLVVMLPHLTSALALSRETFPLLLPPHAPIQKEGTSCSQRLESHPSCPVAVPWVSVKLCRPHLPRLSWVCSLSFVSTALTAYLTGVPGKYVQGYK